MAYRGSMLADYRADSPRLYEYQRSDVLWKWNETSTSAARTWQHGRRTHGQYAPHGTHCIESGLAEERSSAQVCQRKEAGRKETRFLNSAMLSRRYNGARLRHELSTILAL